MHYEDCVSMNNESDKKQQRTEQQMDIYAEETPLCEVCKHHHHQGSKCSVCGHVGKCSIFPKMKLRAQELHSFKAEFYDPSNIQENGQWDILAELRKRIYCTEMCIPAEEEFVSQQEGESRHMIGYIGDAPIALARYHIELLDNTSVAVVDRFGVLVSHRGRGVARQCLPLLLSDVHAVSQGAVTGLFFSTPLHSTMHDYGLSKGSVARGVDTRGGVPFARLLYPSP